MQKEDRADKKQAFLEICHRHRLKVTPQRVAIYNALIEADTHPSADTIYQIVINEYTNISYDTVNRTLLTFAQIGVADIVETFGGAKRFDPNVRSHHHLHCTRCGKVIDFYHRDYDNLAVPESVNRQFKVIGKRVVLSGICNACQK